MCRVRVARNRLLKKEQRPAEAVGAVLAKGEDASLEQAKRREDEECMLGRRSILKRAGSES